MLNTKMDRNDEIKPKIGMQFNSEEDAYQFYNCYGCMMGFSIRKQYAHKSRQDVSMITSRMFSCSKQGFKVKDRRDRPTVKYPRKETRTNCEARMRIKLMENGKYECADFFDAHNHELHTPSTTHMMRSLRKISNTQAFEIELGDETKDIQYMGAQVGGSHNVGVDNCNYLQTRRRKGGLCYGEVGSMLQYFEDQVRRNPLFTYAVQLDVDELVTNIFWADAKMIIDYALFGDVVTFDTTFCTNKENRPFGIFYGFNHHKGVVVFGAALLYDETVESYKWLFKTFLETHGQKKPKTIFTDQDVALSLAVSEVFIGTNHYLCSWQLMQHAIKYLRNLRKEETSFLSILQKCMYEYEEEVDFEAEWRNSFSSYYVVGDNSWLDCAYKIKDKWARSYMKCTFIGGMQNTQLSESLNAEMKDHIKHTTHIVCFLKHFARIVESKRENELKAEFDAQSERPNNKHNHAPIMCQAAMLYTPKIFDLFQDEYDWMPMCHIKHRNEYMEVREYVIGIWKSEKEYQVKCNPHIFTVECSCRKFESMGILCCHVLKVLDILDIKLIPEAYILSRWTRTARSMSQEYDKKNQVEEDMTLDQSKCYTFLCHTLIKIASQASRSVEGFEYVKRVAYDMCQHLDNLVLSTPNPNEDDHSNENPDLNVGKRLKEKIRKKNEESNSKVNRKTISELEKRKRKNQGPSSHTPSNLVNHPKGLVMAHGTPYSFMPTIQSSQASASQPTNQGSSGHCFSAADNF